MTPKAERNRSRLSRRLELAHHLLAESGRLMRILSAIVEPLLMVVLDTRHDLLLGRLESPQGKDSSCFLISSLHQLNVTIP